MYKYSVYNAQTQFAIASEKWSEPRLNPISLEISQPTCARTTMQFLHSFNNIRRRAWAALSKSSAAHPFHFDIQKSSISPIKSSPSSSSLPSFPVLVVPKSSSNTSSSSSWARSSTMTRFSSPSSPARSAVSILTRNGRLCI
jgi:hypothetical protein